VDGVFIVPLPGDLSREIETAADIVIAVMALLRHVPPHRTHQDVDATV
jgi:hypothetical protein